MKYPGLFSLSAAMIFLAFPAGCGGGGRASVPPPAAEPVHPAFTLTSEAFGTLVAGIPEVCRRNILKRPRDFLDLAEKILGDDPYLIVLVDKAHPLPAGYTPSDLVMLRDYPLRLSRTNLQLRAVLIPDLLAMAEAARRDGAELLLSSAYRSESYQKTVYERIVRELGQEAADRESARPGRSQHQLGTAIDFGSISDAFTGTPMQLWLSANAGKYGFSLSYPEGSEELTGYRHESWHYRYIGRAAAGMEREFFEGLQQIMLEFFHRQGPALAQARTGR